MTWPLCVHCARPMPPSTRRQGRCDACAKWRRRHPETERPLERARQCGPGRCRTCGAERRERRGGQCITCAYPDRAARVRARRAAALAPPPLPPGETPGGQLRALRRAYGWSQATVARATYYSQSAIAQYEAGRRPVPPALQTWVAQQPRPPQRGSYPPTAGGLRRYLVRKRMRVVELAAFVGASEVTVTRWLTDVYAVPPTVRAWLAAGAPPAWPWAPPGLDEPAYRPDRRRTGRKAHTRPEGHVRRRASTLVRRWAAAAQPRPGRRVA